jgi:hypothetical protein
MRIQDPSTIVVQNGFSSLCEFSKKQTNCGCTQKHCKFDLGSELQTFAVEGIVCQITFSNSL